MIREIRNANNPDNQTKTFCSASVMLLYSERPSSFRYRKRVIPPHIENDSLTLIVYQAPKENLTVKRI
jgi:hypothetical protein